jgi:prepilin-type N-terminal cleavage/methylation domain-containing protein
MTLKENSHNRRQEGFTLIEMMVALVASSLVLAGAYSLLRTHQQQGHALDKKIDLRNELSLCSKKLQRSITLAGIGLNGSVNLGKEDAVGSDSLIIYTNLNEVKSALTSDISAFTTSIHVANPSIFSGASYIALSTTGAGEIRPIVRIEGSTIQIATPFSRPFPSATSTVYPAKRERYYSDQSAHALIHEVGSTSTVVAKNIHNFQVSFRNKNGEPTEVQGEVRTVQFSFTGIFPAKKGAISSMVFSSTAIPRNIL